MDFVLICISIFQNEADNVNNYCYFVLLIYTFASFYHLSHVNRHNKVNFPIAECQCRKFCIICSISVLLCDWNTVRITAFALLVDRRHTIRVRNI